MKLTDPLIKSIKPADKPKKFTDGGGLNLLVTPSGSKLWRYRYRLNGKESMLSLGDYPTVTLKAARLARDEVKSLLAQGIEAFWLEPRSMNTCENARFSALLLLKQGGAARVELVTDAYHMPRARRLFAANGIDTVPVVAPLPGDPTVWWPDRRNLVHTRRALHELAANVRDVWVGEINCREVP